MLEQFCKSILGIKVGNSKALANLVMALSSETNARSVVELSLGSCYHYQYSSISKVLDKLHEKGDLKDKEAASERLSSEKKFVFEKGLYRKDI